MFFHIHAVNLIYCIPFFQSISPVPVRRYVSLGGWWCCQMTLPDLTSSSSMTQTKVSFTPPTEPLLLSFSIIKNHMNMQLHYKCCVTSQAMFTSSRQDLGFQRSSGTKTWRRLVEAVDLRYVQHTHSSVWTMDQVWSDETSLLTFNKNGGMEYMVCKVPTKNTGINSRNRETKTRYKVMYSSLYNTGLQNVLKV